MNLLEDALFVILVTGHLREDLEAFEHSAPQALLVEIVTILFVSAHFAAFLGLTFEAAEKLFFLAFLGPLVDQAINYLFIPIIFAIELLALQVQFHEVLVQLRQLFAFLRFQLFDFFV